MERLEKVYRTSDDHNLFRCRECWFVATDGFDNGFVPTLPYPHNAHCQTRNQEESK
jgi:hypothetical protein